MNMNKGRLDDAFGYAAIAIAAAMAIGVCLASAMGYALDRGSVQARVGDSAREVRIAAAASAAEKARRETKVTAGAP